MKLSRTESRFVDRTIDQWLEEGVITSEDSKKLKGSYQIANIDWSIIAKYSFWIAIVCIVFSVLSVLLDEWLIKLFEEIFTAPDIVKSGFFALISGLFYTFGLRRKRLSPDKMFSNEALFVLGIVSTALSIYFLGQVIQADSLTKLILLAAFVYGVLGLWIPSLIVWLCALLTLGCWFGFETYQASELGYFIGLNFPLRFVLFGSLLIGASSWALRRWDSKEDFVATTRAVGLSVFFISMWLMSIFGNFGDWSAWSGVDQFSLIHWSVLLLIASIASLYHGMKYDDELTRGFGLIFIFINLYTRFIEYFWEGTHKAVLFAILAISFWFFGTRAEKIYRIGRANEKPNCD
ncbi:hypothetical protein BCU70_06930 [Vibrio sp. 10N.286.49.C2]|uniref:DUF2157 domain-containing protein n=1 Tax=unclassified Vibrio TaxID=2614977 RepID=UPI000C842106|nr:MULTISPECIES: DUF2157 domain-containing protein [unclassified Vibrio]PMH31618.1 hypothetical protein BCU70_06930 [Vibrio sp. 10N.286.49.C2]PMH50640.1 hypothetical protein BCU66_19290 [Vibrio sp. 10N.286.49.B1]PMH79307.1 hypothetical protein BCU58_05730 [Vibrio sp. 10N.286.48.B7]